MSDRGSILISTANDIGEALVEKLGGEGYAPSVWDKEYNKLGIAEVDSAPALSVLENSSETGTARGSILMSTANAIGAMLNKKYNTDRGFKPKEWASAGRKMKALETDTKSGSIVNIQGAKETPLLSLVGTIDPTIEGTSEVNAYKLGKNLCANNLSTESVSGVDITIGTDGTITLDGKATARITRSLCTNFFLKKGTYVLSCGTPNLPASCYLNLNGGGLSRSCTINTASVSFTLSEDATIIYIRIDLANGSEFDNFKIYPMLEVGSSASAYEPYKTPTTYTADLGETVHGGKVDFIKGEVTDAITETKTFTGAVSEVWQYSSAYGWFYIDNQFSDAYRNNQEKDFMACNLGTQQAYANVTVLPNMTFACTSGTNSRFVFKNTDYDNVDDFKAWLSSNNMVVAYRKSDFVPFSITPIEINTSGDVENYYTSAGDTSIEYYAVPTPYTRGTASGAIANVQNARTDLPFTKVKANIAPSIAGTDEVNVLRAKKNISSVSEYSSNPWTFWGTNFVDMVSFLNNLKNGTYTISFDFEVETVPDSGDIQYGLPYIRALIDGNYVSLTTYSINTAASVSVGDIFHVSASFTLTNERVGKIENCYLYCDRKDSHSGSTGRGRYNLINVQIEVGSTATEYTPYQEPTVYTADLGETVYGGSVDLVSGEKVKTSARIKISDLNWSIQTVSGRSAFVSGQVSNMPTTSPKIVLCDVLPYDGEKTIGGMTDKTLATWTNTFRIYDTDIADVTELISAYGNGYITYPLVTNIESSIAGQVIVPSEGVNNLWNNAGGDTDVEYFTTE